MFDILYEGQEWEKIAQFSLDERFQGIWDGLSVHDDVRELANLPCVGDGRSAYEPRLHSRTASHTLRSHFQIEIADACTGWKCEQRTERGWARCSDLEWADPPDRRAAPDAAVLSPLGATLTIVYQIRNNLFHGMKHEYAGPDHERNLTLVRLSTDIVQYLMRECTEILQVDLDA